MWLVVGETEDSLVDAMYQDVAGGRSNRRQCGGGNV